MCLLLLQAIVGVSRHHKLLWSKQKVLGVVVANMTGRPQMPLSEAEYCGNLMDRHVRDYVKKINKLAKSQRRREQRHAAQVETSIRCVCVCAKHLSFVLSAVAQLHTLAMLEHWYVHIHTLTFAHVPPPQHWQKVED